MIRVKKKIRRGQLSQDLKWLAPYLEAVNHLVLLDRVKSIKYYTSRKHHKREHHYAITHRLGDNKTYYILIRTNIEKSKRIPLDYNTQEDVLIYVAHELAHCVPGGWEHGPEHFKIMSEIFAEFGKVLHKIGFEKDRNKR